MKQYYLLIISSAIIFSAFITPIPEEGMFPLSEIRNLDLNEAGLKINIDEVYNPNGISLVDALVNIGGCTGSFISDKGLMITNHHCSFGAVQRASTTENNYLENGFLAKSYVEEIPASGITCRITVSYEDVSEQILKAAESTGDITKRMQAISSKMQEIVKDEERKDTTIKASVSEMFPGESYILFRYQTINDVRLVYVPPRNIGEFGGEADNWVWPRHTGDFAFLRAYVAPDGSPAPYSKDNVPFTPKKHLKVNAEGVDENDFVFILGYPGRTYKNQSAAFVEYQKNFQLPYVQNLYEWIINFYEEAGKGDSELMLELSSKIKSLANTEKNYRGKLQGLERLKIIEKKRNEESELTKYINSDSGLKTKYGNVLDEINEVYAEMSEFGRLPFIARSLPQNVSMYRLAEILVEQIKELKKPDSERKSLYKDDNYSLLINTVNGLYKNMHPKLEDDILVKILTEASKYPETQSFVDAEGEKDIHSFVSSLYKNTILNDRKKYLELLEKKSLDGIQDPYIDFVAEIEKVESFYEARLPELEGKLNILLASFTDIKRKWINKDFVPDANSTLRLTYGYVKGYSPADATYYSPITTLSGLIEKGKEEGDYQINKKLVELYNKKDFGKFKDDKLNEVPVAILYSTDTSGGNSGSPVLDAFGNLVAINFDRSFEATINDYAWSEDYSRSIGVDIRYVLWVTQKIGGADFLLKEIGVL